MLESELKFSLELAREQEAEADKPPFRAPAGAGVILDPRDGSVLAMASFPTFAPSDFIEGISQEQFADLEDPLAQQPLLNRAISEIYPPGSTFKPFTAIAAEVYDVFGWEFVEPFDVFTSDPGFWRLRSCLIAAGDDDAARAGGCIKRNAGDATMEGVDLQFSLTFSSDTYYYKLGEAFWIAPDSSEIDPNGIQNIASDFGLGTASGIQLAGEKAGVMPTAELMRERFLDNPEAFPRGDWNPGDNTNIAIGQGDVAVTPLQLANAYATLANGGTLYAPNIVTRIEPNDEVAADLDPSDLVLLDRLLTPDEVADGVVNFGPRVIREIEIPATVGQPILDGLLGVTLQPKVTLDRPSGTAWNAFNEPDKGGVAFPLYTWPVAGKTGTAEIGNGTLADNSMFAAFGPSGSVQWGTPILEPEYAIAVILEESGFGSKAAAPMVARLFEKIAADTVPRALTRNEIDEFYGVDQITDLQTQAAVDATGGDQ